MDQSPTNNQADPGIWDQGIRNTQGSAAAAKGRGSSLAGGRQITRNRASYSCHSCRRRKVKCDKVRAVFLESECLTLIAPGSSHLWELRKEWKRMRVRCDAAAERCRTAHGTNEGRTWCQKEEGDVAAAGGGCRRTTVDIRSFTGG